MGGVVGRGERKRLADGEMRSSKNHRRRSMDSLAAQVPSHMVLPCLFAVPNSTQCSRRGAATYTGDNPVAHLLLVPSFFRGTTWHSSPREATGR